MKKSLLIREESEQLNDLFNAFTLLGYKAKNELKSGVFPFVITVEEESRTVRHLYFDAACDDKMISSIEKNCVSINEIFKDLGIETEMSKSTEDISETPIENEPEITESTVETIETKVDTDSELEKPVINEQTNIKTEPIVKKTEIITDIDVQLTEETACEAAGTETPDDAHTEASVDVKVETPVDLQTETKVSITDNSADVSSEDQSVENTEPEAEENETDVADKSEITESSFIDVAIKLYTEVDKAFKGVDRADKCKIIGEMITRCIDNPKLIPLIMQPHKTVERMWDYIMKKVKRISSQNSLFSSDYIVYNWAEEYFMLDDKAKIEEEERIKAEKKAKAEEEAKIKAEKEAKKKERAAKKAEREAKKKAKEEAEKAKKEAEKAKTEAVEVKQTEYEEPTVNNIETPTVPVTEVVTSEESVEVVADDTGLIEETVSPENITDENIEVSIKENNQIVDLESEKVANELASISEASRDKYVFPVFKLYRKLPLRFPFAILNLKLSIFKS